MYVARMQTPDDDHQLVVATVLAVRDGNLYAAGDLALVDTELRVPTADGFVALQDDPEAWLLGLPQEYRTPYLVVEVDEVPEESAGQMLAGLSRI